MAIEDHLDHNCSIWHMVTKDEPLGYGLTNTSDEIYPEIADLDNVKCHFGMGASASVSMTKARPDMLSEVRLTLPVGTDVRMNDRVLWKETGLFYSVKLVRNVRNNHIKAMCWRKEGDRAL